MLTVGIDAHDRLYAMCILDANGKVFKEHVVRGGVDEVAAWLKGLGQPVRVCYEASLGYGLLYDRLRPVAVEVKVAHPSHLRAIWKSKRKNDRIDARALATLMYLDRLPEIHVPSRDVREWRVLIEHRTRLVHKRTAAKNGLRALLRSQGIQALRGCRLWSKKGQAWAQEVKFESVLTALRRDQLLAEIAHHNAQIMAVEAQLDQIAQAHPGVALLRTIPGVGPRTAEAVMAYVDDPHRFSSTRQAGSYFGIVPSLDESGGVKRYGHITRAGPATVRKLLAEAALQAKTKSPKVRAFFERVKGGRKERNAKAIVATAHYLVRVMVAMLKSGEEWREPSDTRQAA